MRGSTDLILTTICFAILSCKAQLDYTVEECGKSAPFSYNGVEASGFKVIDATSSLARLTFDEARAVCHAQGKHLPMLKSADLMNRFLISYGDAPATGCSVESFWIQHVGCSDQSLTADAIVGAVYTEYAASTPQCMFVSRGGGVGGVSCNLPVPTICMDGIMESKTDQTVEAECECSKCPEGFDLFENDYCYKIISASSPTWSFTDAESECAAAGGKLFDGFRPDLAAHVLVNMVSDMDCFHVAKYADWPDLHTVDNFPSEFGLTVLASSQSMTLKYEPPGSPTFVAIAADIFDATWAELYGTPDEMTCHKAICVHDVQCNDKCPEGFDLFENDYCYKVMSAPYTLAIGYDDAWSFTDAESECAAAGGKLFDGFRPDLAAHVLVNMVSDMDCFHVAKYADWSDLHTVDNFPSEFGATVLASSQSMTMNYEPPGSPTFVAIAADIFDATWAELYGTADEMACHKAICVHDVQCNDTTTTTSTTTIATPTTTTTTEPPTTTTTTEPIITTTTTTEPTTTTTTTEPPTTTTTTEPTTTTTETTTTTTETTTTTAEPTTTTTEPTTTTTEPTTTTTEPIITTTTTTEPTTTTTETTTTTAEPTTTTTEPTTTTTEPIIVTTTEPTITTTEPITTTTEPTTTTETTTTTSKPTTTTSEPKTTTTTLPEPRTTSAGPTTLATAVSIASTTAKTVYGELDESGFEELLYNPVNLTSEDEAEIKKINQDTCGSTGWTLLNPNNRDHPCYQLYSLDELTYDEANRACACLGGQLPHFTGLDQYQAFRVNAFNQVHPNATNIWLDMSLKDNDDLRRHSNDRQLTCSATGRTDEYYTKFGGLLHIPRSTKNLQCLYIGRTQALTEISAGDCEDQRFTVCQLTKTTEPCSPLRNVANGTVKYIGLDNVEIENVTCALNPGDYAVLECDLDYQLGGQPGVKKVGVTCRGPQWVPVVNLTCEKVTDPIDEDQAAISACMAVGCFILILILVAGLLLGFIARDFSNERIYHMCEEITLLLIHALMMGGLYPNGVLKDEYKDDFCELYAIAMNFLCTSLFTLFTLEAYHQHSVLCNLTPGSFKHPIPTPYIPLVGFGLPVVVVAITAALHYGHFSSDYSCWINYSNPSSMYALTYPILGLAWISAFFTEEAGRAHLDRLPLQSEKKWSAALLSQTGMTLKLLLNLFVYLFGSYTFFHRSINYFATLMVLHIVLAVFLVVVHIMGNSVFNQLVRKLTGGLKSKFQAMDPKKMSYVWKGD